MLLISLNSVFAQDYIRVNANVDNVKTKKHVGIIAVGFGFPYWINKPDDYFIVGTYKVKLNIINGYQFNPYTYLGLGVGFNLMTKFDYYLFYPQNDVPVVPLFSYFKANFTNKDISPYFSLGLGYAFCLIKDYKISYNYFSGNYKYKGGLLFSPTLGVNYRLPSKKIIHFGVNYESQWMKRKYKGVNNYNNQNMSFEDKYIFSSLNIIIGIYF